MTDLADSLHVDPADVEVIVEWMRADGAEDDLGGALRGYLGADERALAWAGSPAAQLAARYRINQDPGLLEELRERGHTHIVGHLQFEQPQDGDPSGVLVTRANTRELVDKWIETDPPDPYRGPLTYRLGSPTDRGHVRDPADQ